MKPSERIKEIAKELQPIFDPDEFDYIGAIMNYLDEQWEKNSKLWNSPYAHQRHPIGSTQDYPTKPMCHDPFDPNYCYGCEDASMEVVNSDEGTGFYSCSKCKKPLKVIAVNNS